jgi:hypothetical protein
MSPSMSPGFYELRGAEALAGQEARAPPPSSDASFSETPAVRATSATA